MRSTGQSDNERWSPKRVPHQESRNRRRTKAREYVEQRLGIRDFDELTEILRDAERSLSWAPPRSTFYGWVSEWKTARARDRSGRWSLSTDETGRPDIVMSVLAALVGRSHGRHQTLTVAEARWLVRLGTAVPDILADGRHLEPDESGVFNVPGQPSWGTLSLWSWALHYVDAETAGDDDALAELDGKVAMLYANGGRHFAEAMADD